MAPAFIARSCMGLGILLCSQGYARQYEPLFCSMDQQCPRVAKREAVGTFAGFDQHREHTLFLLADDADQPLLFYADITASVCADEACKPVRIELYWDLLGNYVGYGVPPDCPLTKYDHVLFEPIDYWKLHQVLSDRDSVLGRRVLADLIDPNSPSVKQNITHQGTPVDAVSGATSKEITHSIVPGALYSCYAIWHLAHGDIRRKIVQHLRSVYGPTLMRRFLQSDRPVYQAFAIAEMDATQVDDNLPRVLEILQGANSSTRAGILKDLPKHVWRKKLASQVVYRLFSTLAVDTRTLLIQNLDNAHPAATSILVAQVETMTKNQLGGYLACLSAHPALLSKSIRAELHRVSADEHYAYCYVIGAFLEDQ